ncbi:MAG: ECF-type sigma factor [Acidobacteriota bacterium]
MQKEPHPTDPSGHDHDSEQLTRELFADGDLTSWLDQWAEGDRARLGDVVTFLYRELHRLAASSLRRERPEHTLQPTAVVHELYLALVDQTGIRFRNRNHFIGLAAHMMRRILVQHARDRGRQKRGGDRQRIPLDHALDAAIASPSDLLALEDALRDLASVDPRKVRLVELRFFGGLSLDDAAVHLGVSRATAVREWTRTRAWLYRELAPPEPSSEPFSAQGETP